MTVPRIPVPSAVILAIGVALGWGLATFPARPLPLRAGGADRSGESIVAAGPVMLTYDDRMRVQIAQDALYYLDYKGGRLLATIPSSQQSAGSSKLLDQFAERDLLTDFKLEPGTTPHFLLATAGLGAYSQGAAPLFVFETTTKQVAAYRVQQQTVGTVTQPRFELVQLLSLAQPAPEPAAR